MDFNLDGCAPNPFSITTISLCDIENEIGSGAFDTLFNISWELHLDNGGTFNLGSDLQLYNVIDLNSNLFPISGTEFPNIGSYLIELIIDYTGDSFVYNNVTVSNNGAPLTATDDMTLYIVNISEPSMLGLFGLGWGFVAYRRRRKSGPSRN